MQWRGRQGSQNVEDRRGRGGGVAIGGGATILIVLAISLLTGRNPMDVAREIAPQQQGQAAGPRNPADDEQAQMIGVVLKDTEDTWNELLPKLGHQYEEPKLVLFTGAVQSACGNASAAVGPFYCPRDRQVYLDLSFFRELDERFGAPGDFARAYVVAHEVGHHVQTLLGIQDQFQAQVSRLGQEDANALSVRMELQADCLAGVWGYHAASQRQLLESGDVEEGLQAAAAIGDDQIQKQTQGYVVPEGFTHGTSEQRVRWFRRGLEGGDPNSCDTFSARQL
jgi:predicted metalloprotease